MSKWSEGMVRFKELDDGRYIGIMPMTFGNYRLVLGKSYSLLDGY